MRHLPLMIVGNLTGEPELRFTPSGAAVCRFTVAHNPSTYDKQAGEWKDGEPTFIDCSAWRGLAENLAESLKPGARVILYGNLRTHRWESDGSGKTPAGEKIARMVLDVIAAGPELTWATAKVAKVTRRGETAPDDPWATASRKRPDQVPAGPAGNFDEEPPF